MTLPTTAPAAAPSDGAQPQDPRHMAHALALAARGLGNVWPNPAVGCVIVSAGRIVGRGWTQPGGRPHAEAMALAQAGAAARGATAYVTLEPCAHRGRGPPCADALAAAGVARVVVALTDPDPRTDGQGIARLRAAGIVVAEDVLRARAAALNAGFLARLRLGRPFVTLKLAMSLDGRIADGAGASHWVTGAEARGCVHAMRLAHDAVMVGIGTALADDPELTVRGMGAVRQPVRVLLDTGGRLPSGSRLATGAADAPVWLCHGPAAAGLPEGVTGIRCRIGPDGHLDLTDTLRRLADRGLTRILCEGGAGIAAALVGAGLADEVALFSAGRLFGAGGTAALAALSAAPVSAAPDPTTQDPGPHDLGPPAPATQGLGPPDYRLVASERLGADLLHRWIRAEG